MLHPASLTNIIYFNPLKYIPHQNPIIKSILTDTVGRVTSRNLTARSGCAYKSILLLAPAANYPQSSSPAPPGNLPEAQDSKAVAFPPVPRRGGRLR